MDIYPISIINDAYSSKETEIVSNEDVLDMHDILQNEIRKSLRKNDGETITLSDVDQRMLELALTKQKDFSAKDRLDLKRLNDQMILNDKHSRDQIILNEYLARRNVPISDTKNVSNIKKGDLLILSNEDEPTIENLVIMANSDVVDDYVMGIPVSFDESLASNVSSIVEPEDNKKNSQVKNWTFALIDEIESRFHVGYIKSNGWLDKITNISDIKSHNYYAKKRGRKILNEYDSRAPQRAALFDLVDYYKNLPPKKPEEIIKFQNSTNFNNQLTG